MRTTKYSEIGSVLQALACTLFLFACAGPTPGPDKQFEGTLRGAASGAGAGAVTGLHIGAGTGPGALVGAGLGAVAGGISGYGRDRVEDEMLAISARTRAARQVGYAHEVLGEHFKRRMELHPTRDIFPADIFFYGDEYRLRSDAKGLVREIVRLNKNRLPWSRLAVTAYVRSTDPKSPYAKDLARKRAKAIGNMMVRSGIEPRRVIAQAVVIDEPLVIDPHDDPERYNQAVELIPLDFRAVPESTEDDDEEPEGLYSPGE